MNAKTLRCAIYTRKSSEEGLEQDFNSLDAQREACQAYVLSQAGEGWTALPTVYDDGGFSGGSMDRPGLKQLMADIEKGRIDIVVVYKVDRLTRSLADFARIVELFDRKGVSFVSVTQAFNTTSSMGRLTLNVLLSFAQFEREVTGERIRDKIAASKRKGMWMGGNPPLGYEPNGRTLAIVPAEAETVRMIFRRYLELRSVHRLKEALDQEGVVSKLWTSQSGIQRGGTPMGRGALFYLLRNRLYVGEIPHKTESHPGQHPAIIDLPNFEAVQARLDEGIQGPRNARKRRPTDMLLAGILHDAGGSPMSPVKARRKGGVTYRYYVSSAVLKGEAKGENLRVSAPAIEALVEERLKTLGVEPLASSTDPVSRFTLGTNHLEMILKPTAIDRAGGVAAVTRRLPAGDRLTNEGDQFILTLPVRFLATGRQVVAVGPDGRPAIDKPVVDDTLCSALIRAETWKRRLFTGEAANVEALATEEQVRAQYIARVIRIAFLAPDLKRAILEGRQPPRLNLQAIITADLPLSWADQRRRFAA